MCYQSHDKTAIGILTCAWAAIMLLLLWCISMSFERTVYKTHWLGTMHDALRTLISDGFDKWHSAKEQTSEKASV